MSQADNFVLKLLSVDSGNMRVIKRPAFVLRSELETVSAKETDHSLEADGLSIKYFLFCR
jgi:hypothetical protein